jgi:hypothetical protein
VEVKLKIGRQIKRIVGNAIKDFDNLIFGAQMAGSEPLEKLITFRKGIKCGLMTPNHFGYSGVELQSQTSALCSKN